MLPLGLEPRARPREGREFAATPREQTRYGGRSPLAASTVGRSRTTPRRPFDRYARSRVDSSRSTQPPVDCVHLVHAVSVRWAGVEPATDLRPRGLSPVPSATRAPPLVGHAVPISPARFERASPPLQGGVVPLDHGEADRGKPRRGWGPPPVRPRRGITPPARGARRAPLCCGTKYPRRSARSSTAASTRPFTAHSALLRRRSDADHQWTRPESNWQPSTCQVGALPLRHGPIAGPRFERGAVGHGPTGLAELPHPASRDPPATTASVTLSCGPPAAVGVDRVERPSPALEAGVVPLDHTPDGETESRTPKPDGSRPRGECGHPSACLTTPSNGPTRIRTSVPCPRGTDRRPLDHRPSAVVAVTTAGVTAVGACFGAPRECHTGPCRFQTLPGPSGLPR